MDEELIPKKSLQEGWKKPLKKTKYQSPDNCTWDKYKPPEFDWDEDENVRKKFERMVTSHSAGVGNPLAAKLFGAQSILREALGSKNRITDVIMRHDPKNSFGAKPDDPTILQALHRMQTEAASGEWINKFKEQASNGVVQTIQSLLSKGMSGAGGLTNILSQFKQIAQQSLTMTSNQNKSQIKQQPIPPGVDPTQEGVVQ